MKNERVTLTAFFKLVSKVFKKFLTSATITSGWFKKPTNLCISSNGQLRWEVESYEEELHVEKKKLWKISEN